MNILPQISQMTHRNGAGCIITQRKTDWVIIVVLCFVCVNQRDQRETLGFHLCGLIEYSCVLFSRRWRRENAVGCIISQRKTAWVVIVVLVVCLRKSARSAGYIGVSFVQIV